MNNKKIINQTILLILIAVAFILCTSCGRRRDDDCRSREAMRMECQVVNQPHYGRPYAQEMCNRNYSAERCY